MKNIFLTGEVGVGKSTVISKVLSLLPQVICGGFRTVSEMPIIGGNLLEVYIEKAWEQTPHDAEHMVGTRLGHGRFTSYQQTFDTVGTPILFATPANATLILMDELGMMEDNATLFRQAVMNALDGELPVLGVIKPKHTDFLDAIRAHESSEIIEVTLDNRDELPAHIAGLLRSTGLR